VPDSDARELKKNVTVTQEKGKESVVNEISGERPREEAALKRWAKSRVFLFRLDGSSTPPTLLKVTGAGH